jgi:hypothetical protein
MENSSSSIIKFGIFSKLIFTLVSIFYFSTFLNKNFNLIWGNIPLFSILRGLGIGDWGLGIGPNPQSPIPNPYFKTYENYYII